jgi:hypothetical protein
VVLATITMPSFPLLNLPPATATAAAVAALPDGSRAYVGSYATLPSQLTIASVSGDGTTATYAYSLTAGQVLNPGLTLTVSGTGIGFDGAMVVSAIVSGTSTCPGTCFEASNATSGSWPPAGTTGAATGAGSNIFPQVSVVNVSTNSISTTIAMPGFPDATDPSTPQFYVAACVAPTPPIPYRATFRFMMAAGGDSTRAYLSSCDGGMVNIINTATDSYILSMAAPVGTRPNPAGAQLQNLPQSPVFLIAGP